jgi:hypothetical protein
VEVCFEDFCDVFSLFFSCSFRVPIFLYAQYGAYAPTVRPRSFHLASSLFSLFLFCDLPNS